jgi:hypothetical protein
MRGSRELWVVGGVSMLMAVGILAVGLIPFNRAPTPPVLDPAAKLLLATGGVTLAPPADKRIPDLVAEANKHGVPAGVTQPLISWSPARAEISPEAADRTVTGALAGQSVPSSTVLAYASSVGPTRFRVKSGFVSRVCNRDGSCVQGRPTCVSSATGCLVAGGRLAHRLCWVVAGDGIGPMAGRKTVYLVDARTGQLVAGYQG